MRHGPYIQFIGGLIRLPLPTRPTNITGMWCTWSPLSCPHWRRAWQALQVAGVERPSEPLGWWWWISCCSWQGERLRWRFARRCRWRSCSWCSLHATRCQYLDVPVIGRVFKKVNYVSGTIQDVSEWLVTLDHGPGIETIQALGIFCRPRFPVFCENKNADTGINGEGVLFQKWLKIAQNARIMSSDQIVT